MFQTLHYVPDPALRVGDTSVNKIDSCLLGSYIVEESRQLEREKKNENVHTFAYTLIVCYTVTTTVENSEIIMGSLLEYKGMSH